MIANIFHIKGISNSMKSLDFTHSTRRRLKGFSKNQHSTKISPTKMYGNSSFLSFKVLRNNDEDKDDNDENDDVCISD